MSDKSLAHHKYRLAHGLYPESMRQVVEELILEVERARKQRDEIDQAFVAWRKRAREEGVPA